MTAFVKRQRRNVKKSEQATGRVVLPIPPRVIDGWREPLHLSAPRARFVSDRYETRKGVKIPVSPYSLQCDRV
jgi:hypothetical protein